jgi:5'-nucleotidase
MDGVIADWKGGIEFNLMGTGEDLSILDWTRWEGVRVDAGPEASALVARAMATPGFYWHLEPIEGAVEALRALDRHHDVWLCSTPDSTNPSCASDKLDWAEHHLGAIWRKRVILTHDKTLVRGDILIDDKPEVTGDADPEWVHVLFDQPYNQHVEGKAVISQWRDPDVVVRSIELYMQMRADDA